MNGHGDDISVGGLDSLFTTNVNGFVINLMLEPFPLSRRMNGMSASNKCILMHNTNNGSFRRVKNAGDSTNLDVGHLVVVNTLDVNGTITRCDDLDILSSYSTIGSPVHERVLGVDLGSGYRVDNRSNIYFSFRCFLLRKDTADIMRRILGSGRLVLRLISLDRIGRSRLGISVVQEDGIGFRFRLACRRVEEVSVVLPRIMALNFSGMVDQIFLVSSSSWDHCSRVMKTRFPAEGEEGRL